MSQSYIFGGNTGMSYDQIQKQRDIANELLRANMYTPKNVGEGLSAIGRALAAKAIDKRTARAEDEGRRKYEQRRDEVFGMLGGGAAGGVSAPSGPAPTMAGPTPITFTPETANPGNLPASVISAVDRVAPNQPQVMDASAVGTRLLGDLMRDFNLTQEQAAGVVGNLAHETGGFKHMQEIKPVVPGSRGGFGFAQWTGPRRVAFEQWAAEKGLDPTSYEANYGFLQHELQNTPEGAVLGPLTQAQTADEAAKVFSNEFLRPGIPAMGSRTQLAQQFADPQVLMALAEVQGNPFASESDKAIANLLMNQTVQAMDPMRQLEMEKARLELQQMQQPQAPELPADVVELQWRAENAGLVPGTPEYQEFIRTGGSGPLVDFSGANIGGEAQVAPQPQIGTIPQGFSAVPAPDEAAGFRMVPIPGGPEDKSGQEAAAMDAATTASDVVTTAANRALDAARNRQLGGFGQGVVAAVNPFSDSAEVARQVGVLGAQATIETLTAMREASPTGGALGSVTEGELQILKNKSGALDPSSPNFERDLADYTLTLLRTIHGKETGDLVFMQTWAGDMPEGFKPPQKAQPDAGEVPPGIDPEDWRFMTPEERALFK